MTDIEASHLKALFNTGTSGFLQANEHFVLSLLAASNHCAIHASEDIVDANGLKLWARGQPIGERLLERLSNRRLRKPIELCVNAQDPIAAAGIAGCVTHLVEQSEDAAVALGPGLEDVLAVLGSVAPNPTELMLLSVMRHGGRDMVGHAALVAALALRAAALIGVHPDLLRPLARAALLHDVGELYLSPGLFSSTDPRERAQMREIQTHPIVGAQVAMELAGCGSTIGHLISASHERLDGRGYPRGLDAANLSLPSQALLFAEAMAGLVDSGSNGLRRAAVAARLVPGEFPAMLVNWIAGAGAGRPVERPSDLDAEVVGLDLRQMHSLLTKVGTLLSTARQGETTPVRAAVARWRGAMDALMQELRRCGVDSAMSCGDAVEAQSDEELIELAVLSRELLYRVRSFRIAVELAVADAPDLDCSALVIEVVEALRACEPLPQDSAQQGGRAKEALPWSRLYSVGIAEIDEQHRRLVELLNRLVLAQDDADDPDLAGRILGQLVDYVAVHFSFEEGLMRQHGYPGTEAHAASHRRLAERVRDMVRACEQGSAPSQSALVAFLRQWLIAHILHTDKQMGNALNALGVH